MLRLTRGAGQGQWDRAGDRAITGDLSTQIPRENPGEEGKERLCQSLRGEGLKEESLEVPQELLCSAQVGFVLQTEAGVFLNPLLALPVHQGLCTLQTS